MDNTINPYAPSEPAPPLVPASVPVLEAPQSVRYAYTAESLAAWSYYRTLQSPYDVSVRQKARWWIISLMIVLGALILWQIWPAQDAAVASRLIIAGGGFVIFAMLWAVVRSMGDEAAVRSNCRAQFEAYLKESPNHYYLAPQTLTIDHAGLRFEKLWSHAHLAWQAIERIEQTEDYVFLYVASYAAEVIPRTAFATQSEFLGFVNLARRLWESHRGAMPATSQATGQ